MTVLELILSGVVIAGASFVGGLIAGRRRGSVEQVRRSIEERGVEL